MSKIKSFHISTYFWTATIISLLPGIIFLVLDASDWPNNWDDFQRLFNGISTDNKVIAYGIDASNDMMKLAVNYPLLTISNRLRFQFPLLSIFTEVILLISPILVFSRLAYLRGEIWLCIAMSMGFSGLMVVHTVFLPPAAYPLGFSLAFCSALFISIELISYLLHKHSPSIVIIMMIIEQIAFIFYACCYVQSFFITLIGVSIMITLYKHLLTKRKLSILLSVQTIRFSILPLLTFIWRLDHSAVSMESVSSDLNPKGIIYALIKWSFGGTSISTLWGMGHPRVKLTDNIGSSQTLLFLFMTILVFTICLVMWSKVSLHTQQFKHIPTDIKNIFFNKLNPYLATGMIGLSICLAWSLPIASSRYYSEMQQDVPQIYVAMRYASLGLILVITSGIGYLFKSIYQSRSQYNENFGTRLHSTDVTKIFVSCFLPLWLYTGLVNLDGSYVEHLAPQGISLKTICHRENFTSTDYMYFGNVVQYEVIEDGIEHIHGWLPSLNTEKYNIDDNLNLREFIGETFVQNSLRLCK